MHAEKQTHARPAAAVYAAGCAEDAAEGARRGFVMALRVLTARRAREEQQEAELREWTQVLEAESLRYRSLRRKAALRTAIRIGILLLALRFTSGLWTWALIIGIGGGAAGDAASAKRRREAAIRVSTLNDPRAVNALATAFRSGDAGSREIAEGGLRRILPALKASDADVLTPKTRAALNSELNHRSGDFALRMAILQALEQVGDAGAIPAVRQLAAPPPTVGLAVRLVDRLTNGVLRQAMERQQEAARECLVVLEARAELDHQRRTLLRPAASPDDPSAYLVRPAASGAGTPPEQLLRPSSET